MVLVLVSEACFAQAAYPDTEAAAAWRGLAAGYVRKALRDGTLNSDPAQNARLDAVMAAVGTAVAAIDRRFADASWTALLIEGFGRGAAAFPGGIILVDAKFVRQLKLNDDELALILCHEAAHVVAGHASAKLSFMAGILGKERIPTARTALLEFLAKDAYAGEFRSQARLQEREADAIGAAIFAVSTFDPQRALGVFDKLAETEHAGEGRGLDTHDSAITRKRAIAGMISERLRRAAAAPGAATAAAAGP